MWVIFRIAGPGCCVGVKVGVGDDVGVLVRVGVAVKDKVAV